MIQRLTYVLYDNSLIPAQILSQMDCLSTNTKDVYITICFSKFSCTFSVKEYHIIII